MHYPAARWLPNRHLMTVVGNVVRRPPYVPVRRERWELPDGDFLDVDRLAAIGPGAAHAPRVVICHGLEGSSTAGYVLGLMSQLRARGVGAVALNFRSCSGEPNRLPRLYHSGETSDLSFAVDKIVAEHPQSPIALCGFSLGANVVAKYLGERGHDVPRQVRAAAVISTPFDLAGCANAIDGPGLPALAYRERFLRKLRPKALAKASRFPGLIDVERVRRARLLREFDDAVTGPLHGFADAADYYTRCSSGPLLPNIQRPLLVLSAEDDPFIPGETLPVAAMRQNPRVTPLVSRAGGHVGFVAGPPWAMRRWAEETAAEWVANQVREPF